MLKSTFQILIPRSGDDLATQLDDLRCQYEMLPAGRVFHARFYLTDAANQWSVVRESRFCGEFLGVSAVTYIEQPLLCGVKIALLLWCVAGDGCRVERTGDVITLRHPEGDVIYQGVSFGEDEIDGQTALEQTEEAFRRHVARLGERGLTLREHCMRTWLYVRDIDRHYAGVVEGRNRVFAREGLTAEGHFIASTGIGGYADNRAAVLTSEFLSFSAARDVNYLKAPDYLNATAEYGVAFERGTALTFAGDRYRFISGTASIDRNGECLYRGDVLKQTERLFLNIDRLLDTDGGSLADLRYMIVYLRDIADYAAVGSYLADRFPTVPRLVVEARVCRPEWLIEVECVA